MEAFPRVSEAFSASEDWAVSEEFSAPSDLNPKPFCRLWAVSEAFSASEDWAVSEAFSAPSGYLNEPQRCAPHSLSLSLSLSLFLSLSLSLSRSISLSLFLSTSTSRDGAYPQRTSKRFLELGFRVQGVASRLSSRSEVWAVLEAFSAPSGYLNEPQRCAPPALGR